MPKRLCLVVSSKSMRWQPEKLGRRWWKVWNKVLPGDRCRQNGVLVNHVCQRYEWVVPGIAARYREELCSSVLQSYTVCAPGPAASEVWRVRHLHSISDCWRSTANKTLQIEKAGLLTEWLLSFQLQFGTLFGTCCGPIIKRSITLNIGNKSWTVAGTWSAKN